MKTTLWLRCKAPFAAYRWLQAGVYRATSPVIPPSAAWGLVLNLAGIETRGPLDDVVTAIRGDAPALQLAIGTPQRANTATLYQQLHSYPVGSSGKADLMPLTKGAKYWIKPARRELLVGFECVLGVRGPTDVLDRVPRGLAGQLDSPRYGLPFAGDNNLLFDRIDVLASPPPVHWYTQLGDEGVFVSGACRLTVSIDRSDSSRTITRLFAPTVAVTETPPKAAWTWTPHRLAEV
jgi:CRISPR-associated protein Cas5t